MKIVLTGGSSGLGSSIYRALLTALYMDEESDIFSWSLPEVDVTKARSIERALTFLPPGPIDILINCAGVNRIARHDELTEEDWGLTMDTNAKGIWLATKLLLPRLRGGTILNIVSNASHRPMTHSIAYNASKGAAAIMTRQMARELGPSHGITVFGLSPNKLKGTAMSEYIDRKVPEMRGWTEEQSKAYQLAGLASGQETDPDVVAELIAFLLADKRRHQYLAGCILEYGL